MAVCYGAAADALRSFFKPDACFLERGERMDMCLSGCDMAFVSGLSVGMVATISRIPLSLFCSPYPTYNSHANWKTHPERRETLHESTR